MLFRKQLVRVGYSFGYRNPIGYHLLVSALPDSYSEIGADGRIRTGDPLFTNQDFSRPLRVNHC